MNRIYTVTKKEQVLLVTVDNKRVEDFMLRNRLRDCIYYEFEAETGKKLCEKSLIDVYKEQFGVTLTLTVDLEEMADCFLEHKVYDIGCRTLGYHVTDYYTYGHVLFVDIISTEEIMFKMTEETYLKILRRPMYLKELLDKNDEMVFINCQGTEQVYKKIELKPLTNK